MKAKTLILSTLFLGAMVLSLTFCRPDKKEHPLSQKIHESIELKEFKSLTRVQQVQKCGSCHPKQYENEMKGPHANSYRSLKQHFQYVNSNSYECQPYKSLLSRDRKNCLGCHVADNLYENLYKDYGKNEGVDLGKVLMQKSYIIPNARRDSMSWITGVDCLTCHFDGKRVITDNKFKNNTLQTCASYCKPIGSQFFSTSNNCIACHMDVVKSSEIISRQIKSNGKNCNSCHGEYDSSNTLVHYTWWRNNPSEKKSSSRIALFLNEVSFKMEPKNIRAVWINNQMPHDQLECPELIVKFEVLDNKFVHLTEHVLRLNRKELHDRVIFDKIGNKNLPGVTGIELPTYGDSLLFSIPFKLGLRPNYIRITGISKGQYWLDDSTGVKLSSRIVKI